MGLGKSRLINFSKPVALSTLHIQNGPECPNPPYLDINAPVNENVGPVDTSAGSSSFSGDLTGSGDLMLFGSSF